MDKIKATLVLEILGKPAEHIKTALVSLIDKMGTEKGVTILAKDIHDPAPLKDSKDLFTAFAEISVEFDSLSNYFGIMFAYMPAHIEITSPENLTLQNTDLNELGNKLLARLHDYDAITKKFSYERNFLLKKLHEFAPHLFRNPQQSPIESVNNAVTNKNQDIKEESPKKKAKKKKSKE